MIVIRDAASMSSIDDPLVRQRFGELDGDVHFIIVQVGDSVADIESECGFPILTNMVDGSQFGDDEEFVPCAEVIESHLHCYELAFVFSDDAPATILFVPKVIGIDAQLIAMCQSFAVPAPELTER